MARYSAARWHGHLALTQRQEVHHHTWQSAVLRDIGHHDRRPSAPVDRGAKYRRPRPDDAQTTTYPRCRTRRVDQSRTRAQRNARTVLAVADHFDDGAEVLVGMVCGELGIDL